MIEDSKKLDLRHLAALVLALSAACSVSAGGQIPCADDASCPKDYPVCSAQKCVAGTVANAASVAIVAVDGHLPADMVRGTVSVAVTGRAATGVSSVTLGSGSKTYTPATSSAPPLYHFDVPTTDFADGDVALTATITSGDGTTATSPAYTLHIDNTPPVITGLTAGSAPTVSQAFASSGVVVTVDLKVNETATLAGTAAKASASSSMIEVDSGVVGVRRLAFNTGSTTSLGLYKITITATDPAGNTSTVTDSTSTPLKVTVVAAPAIASFGGPVSVSSAGSVGLTYAFSGGTAAITGTAGTGIPITGIAGGGASTVTAPSVTGSTNITVNYTLTVTNAANVSATATISVQALPAPSATLVFTTDATGATSLGGATSVDPHGTVFLKPTFAGGTGMVNGTAATSGPVITVSNVTRTTTFSLLVTSPTGTTAPASATATVNAVVHSFSVSPSIVTNNLATTLTFTASHEGGGASGSAAGTISGTGVAAVSIASGSGQPASQTGVILTTNPTTYTLTVLNSAGLPQSAPATVDVTVVAASQQPAIIASNSVTANSTGNVASVTANPGMTYAWTVTNATITLGGSLTTGSGSFGGGQNSITYTAAGAGPVTLSVTETNAAGTPSIAGIKSQTVVTAPGTPSITAGFAGNVTAGAAGVTASVPAASNMTHAWTLTGGTISGSTTGDSINFTVTAGAGGTVTLNCTESNAALTSANCTPRVLVVVPAPGTPTISTGGFTSVATASSNVATITTNPGMTYSWTVTNANITAGGTGTTGPGVTGTGVNSITYTVTGANGGNVLLSVTETNAANVPGSTAGTKLLAIVTAPTAPVIVAPGSVTAGANGFTATVGAQTGVTFAWTISNGVITSAATGTSITYGAGATGTPLTLNVTATQTATGATVGATPAALTVVTLPIINAFVPAATTVTNGGTTTFTYNITGGDCSTTSRCRISGPSFTFDVPNGNNDSVNHPSSAATPTSSATSNYTLTVVNTTGTVAGTATVTVSVQAVAAPTATGLAASATEVAKGGTVTLTPTYTGATSSYIADGTGAHVANNPTSGSATSAINVNATTTYTLVVTNAAGTSASASVTVVALNTVASTIGTSAARFDATATLLNNGKVLIAGGGTTAAGNGTTGAVLYNPISDTYAATGSLGTARRNHTAHLLGNGQVLVIGGFDNTGAPLGSLELFDPAGNSGAGAFSAFPISGGGTPNNMVTPHALHTSTVLADGTILVAGGCGTSACDATPPDARIKAEVVNLTTAATAATANMNAQHIGATATLLNTGPVLVSGGSTTLGGNGTDFGELFSAGAFSCPGTNCLAGRNPMASSRTGHGAVLLPNGSVALFGGKDSGGTSTAVIELFNPAGTFSANAATLSVPRFRLQATKLGGAGRILVSGGFTTGTTGSAAMDLFDVSVTTLTSVNPVDALSIARGGHTATLLFGGRALIGGGVAATAAGEIFSSAQ